MFSAEKQIPRAQTRDARNDNSYYSPGRSCDNSWSCTISLTLARTLQPFSGDVMNKVADAARVSPLVVVPRDHLYAVAGHHASHEGIDDRGARVSLEVAGNQLFRRVTQKALQRPGLGRRFQRIVHFFRTGLLLDEDDQIHHGNVGS